MTDQLNLKLQKKRLQFRNKFLKLYPEGFNDPKYLEQVRQKKMKAHEKFQSLLNKNEFERLLLEEDYKTIAKNAIIAEKGTQLLYPSEESAVMALSRSANKAKEFATALFNSLYSKLNVKEQFEKFRETLTSFSKQQKKFVSWQMQTAFAFLGNPEHYLFLKPTVIKAAAKLYGYDLYFKPRPNWNSYQSAYGFANQLKQDIGDLNPKDFIDVQAFMQVIASEKTKRSKK